MPYNPYSYPQFYPQGQQYAPSYQQNYPQSYPQSNGITWVTGIEGAKAYPVGAGNNALLVDALYQRLRDCPVPTQPVYGQTPIFTCGGNSCGCGGNF